jgi:hypothetical protein
MKSRKTNLSEFVASQENDKKHLKVHHQTHLMLSSNSASDAKDVSHLVKIGLSSNSQHTLWKLPLIGQA